MLTGQLPISFSLHLLPDSLPLLPNEGQASSTSNIEGNWPPPRHTHRTLPPETGDPDPKGQRDGVKRQRYSPPFRRRTQRTQFTLPPCPRRAAATRLICGTDRKHQHEAQAQSRSVPPQAASAHRRLVEDDVAAAAEGEKPPSPPGHDPAARPTGAARNVTDFHGRRHLPPRRIRDLTQLP